MTDRLPMRAVRLVPGMDWRPPDRLEDIAPRLAGDRMQVSRGGATFLRWRPDGTELFYLGADSHIYAIPTALGQTLRAGDPVALFAVPLEARAVLPTMFAFDVAASGQSALALLAAQDYAAIVCDLRMPQMDGPAVYAALKDIKPQLLERMIFATGDLLNEKTDRFLKDSGRPCIEKPFLPEQIAEREGGQPFPPPFIAAAADGDTVKPRFEGAFTGIELV